MPERPRTYVGSTPRSADPENVLKKILRLGSPVVAVAGRAVWGVPNDPPNPQGHRYGHAMRRAVLRIYRGTRWIPLQTADVRITVVGRGSNAEAMVLVVVGVRPGRMASARACFMAPQWPRKCLFGEDRFERVGADHPAQRSREAAEASSMYHSARPCRSKWSDRRQWVQTPHSSGLAPARTPWSEGVPHSPECARC